MKIKINLFAYAFVTILLSLCHSGAYAFEKQALVFSVDGSKENMVHFNFNGRKFYPPLRLDAKQDKLDSEIKPFYDFFKKMYEVNSSGDKEKILSIWAPGDRRKTGSLMTKDALAQNKERFEALNSWSLYVLMLYGSYYIAYVEYDWGDIGKMMLKLPLKKEGGKLYLTNELNGNHFYDQISLGLVQVNK